MKMTKGVGGSKLHRSHGESDEAVTVFGYFLRVGITGKSHTEARSEENDQNGQLAA